MYNIAERILEIVGIAVADLSGDLGDCHGCMDEEVLRFADAAERDIPHRGYAKFVLEDMCQIKGVHRNGGGNILKADVFAVVAVDEADSGEHERRKLFWAGTGTGPDELYGFEQQDAGNMVGDFAA